MNYLQMDESILFHKLDTLLDYSQLVTQKDNMLANTCIKPKTWPWNAIPVSSDDA